MREPHPIAFKVGAFSAKGELERRQQAIGELVAANRPFQMLSYPNRSHGISEGRGTTIHLYGMFTRFLEENLPPGPKPR